MQINKIYNTVLISQNGYSRCIEHVASYLNQLNDGIEMHSVFSRDLHVIGSFSRDLDVHAEQKHDIQKILSIHKRLLDSAFFLSIVMPRERSMLPAKIRKKKQFKRNLEILKYCIA